MKKSLLALVACAAFCACADDDIASLANGAADGESASGGVVFLTVNIKDASSGTRAADGGFEYGTEDEQRIANAHFYFYDAAGNFSAQGSATGVTGTASELVADTCVNVEFKSNTVVAVWGLEDVTTPKYMVTVLNQPSDFEYGSTLDEMATALANGNCGWQDESGNFVMSTSSFVDYTDVSEEGARLAYFATPIDSTYFRSEPVNLTTDYEKDEEVVQVYVERLAAKVQVDVDFSGISGVIEDETYGYLIPASYLGVNIITKVDVMTGAVLEDEDYDIEKYYVAINGWNLTGNGYK